MANQADPGSSPTSFANEDKNSIATKQKTIFFKIYGLAEEALRKIWTDQTSPFPKQSSQGNQYIMVLTESDSSVILVEPMKTDKQEKWSKPIKPLSIVSMPPASSP
jgi:hypothetical protein